MRPRWIRHFWHEARVASPAQVRKRQTGVRIDEHVLAWFRAQGRGYQARMNAVLRAYARCTAKRSIGRLCAIDPARDRSSHRFERRLGGTPQWRCSAWVIPVE